jgi:phosphoenolpyruvate-protein kinase (PTS system EI component)
MLSLNLIKNDMIKGLLFINFSAKKLLRKHIITSRKLNLPCIMATKIATKALKERDIVEVDANKGIVKIIKDNRNI